jgi:predicted RNase H-like HicB family nuclease
MKYVYPAIFHPEQEGGYCVYFPDIARGATQGETTAECIEAAEDFLCLLLYGMEEGNEAIPAASGTKEVKSEINDIVTPISVDTDDYRRYYENKPVKKSLSVPFWLNQKAKEANVNFSKVLQQALIEELHISGGR